MNKFTAYLKDGGLALIVSIILSLILVLLCAMLAKMFALDANVVTILNTIIKIISVILGEMLSFKAPNNGWIRGIINGIVFALSSNVLYGAIAQNIVFDIGFLADLGLCGVSGLLGGTVAVNLRKVKVIE